MFVTRNQIISTQILGLRRPFVSPYCCCVFLLQPRCCSRFDWGPGWNRHHRGGHQLCGHEEPVCQGGQGGDGGQGWEENQDNAHPRVCRTNWTEQDGKARHVEWGFMSLLYIFTFKMSPPSKCRWMNGQSSVRKWTRTAWHILRSLSSSPVGRQSGKATLWSCTAP